MILDDLRFKAKDLPADARAYWTMEALKVFLEPEVRERFSDQIVMKERPIERVDIAIVTVKPPELLAAKIALGIATDSSEDKNVNGLRFWNTKLECQGLERSANVVLTMLGEQGNVNCAVGCSRLFGTYDIGLCVLVGIAAGVKGKVELGDCVAAELVLDYEHARLEPDGAKKRPRTFEPGLSIARDLEHFQPKRRGWKDDFNNALAKLVEDPFEVGLIDCRPEPTYCKAVILAGEKLIADGSLLDMREEYHERVRAGEMEGAGFGRVCKEFNIPWLIFRGISDFGDPDKAKFPQVVAALSAVTAAIAFVRYDYRKQQTVF